MKDAGWLLTTLGLLLILAAIFLVKVTVDVGYVPSSPYLPSMPREVANLHAMHIQALLVQSGLASIIAGTISLVGANIVEALNRNKSPDALPEPIESAVPETPAETIEPEPEPPVPTPGWVAGVLIVAAIIVLILWSTAHNAGSSSAYNTDEANAAAANLDEAANEVDAAAAALNSSLNDLR